MYIPKPFVQEDEAQTRTVIDDYPFGLLVTAGADGLPIASHVPLLYRLVDGAPILEGHVARPNEQAHHIHRGARALAVFQGPHRYISPTWYESPGVPTWNYAAVHVYGRLSETTGNGAASLVERLAARFEGTGPQAWVPQYPDKMLGGIVCFEMHDLTLQSKSKMSQNRSEADRRGVIEALSGLDDPDARGVVRAMQGGGTDDQ